MEITKSTQTRANYQVNATELINDKTYTVSAKVEVDMNKKIVQIENGEILTETNGFNSTVATFSKYGEGLNVSFMRTTTGDCDSVLTIIGNFQSTIETSAL